MRSFWRVFCPSMGEGSGFDGSVSFGYRTGVEKFFGRSPMSLISG